MNLWPFLSWLLFQSVQKQQPKPSPKEQKDSENAKREDALARSLERKGQQQVKSHRRTCPGKTACSPDQKLPPRSSNPAGQLGGSSAPTHCRALHPHRGGSLLQLPSEGAGVSGFHQEATWPVPALEGGRGGSLRPPNAQLSVRVACKAELLLKIAAVKFAGLCVTWLQKIYTSIWSIQVVLQHNVGLTQEKILF